MILNFLQTIIKMSVKKKGNVIIEIYIEMLIKKIDMWLELNK